MSERAPTRGSALRASPHELDYPSPGCARIVLGQAAVNPDCWELGWIEPFERLLTSVESHISLRGLLVTGFPGCFPSDLDPGILASTARAEAWEALARRLGRCFHRIARMPWTTVAAAGARCTGVGLELALACHVRLIADDPAATVGFPEVAFGRIPSFGGTQRLPRLIGLARAAPWLLSGNVRSGSEAVADGLFHARVPRAELEARALDFAEGRARPVAPPKRSWLREGTRFARRRLTDSLGAALLTGLDPRCLAPRAALEAARDGLEESIERGLELEAQRAARTLDDPATQELARIERLRAEARCLRLHPPGIPPAAQQLPRLVSSSPLVELLPASGASPEAFEAARAAIVKRDEVPLRVGGPGESTVARLLGIFVAEAFRLLTEGLSIPEIDAAAVAFGFPLGPFALVDGIGVARAAGLVQGLEAKLGRRFHGGVLLAALVDGAARSAGARTIYAHPSGPVDAATPGFLGVAWAAAAHGPASEALLGDAQDRLILAIAAEGARLVADRSLENPDQVDLAAIFGFGYPSLRGGPMRDFARRGPTGRFRMEAFASTHGDAFETPPIA